ncbi:MAG: DUF1254 domain-containing protein [Novosphingobium sp.]|nr:DUF1254 domain-containing protein [Novosphingobium sp.]
MTFAQAVSGKPGTPSYDPELADQFPHPRLDDTVPADPAMRTLWARNLAFDATIYGQPAVLIYRQAYDQAIAPGGTGFVGFNRFAHGRSPAGPGYAPFKTPNADTLYSNAYLDLRGGPVLFNVPATAARYYTANFLDYFGNATNISARTHGMNGGRYLIATTDWRGEVPKDRTLFRVASPAMWILLRVLVSDASDAKVANALQDRFVLTPTGTPSPRTWPDGHDRSAIGFFRILDFVLREAGQPVKEEALVYRYKGIGIAGPRSFDEIIQDEASRVGIERGHAEALALIDSSIVQNGRRVGTWSEPLDVGRPGYNYLYRAAVNTLGTGGNVTDENYPFTTFVDADGGRLTGADGPYELRLASPPPARYFWSVTVYDAKTRELFPNAAGKYLVNDRTRGLVRGPSGSVTVRFETGAMAGHIDANTIPVPDGPFYVAIRAQGPLPDLLERRWVPPPVRNTAAR